MMMISKLRICHIYSNLMAAFEIASFQLITLYPGSNVEEDSTYQLKLCVITYFEKL